MTLDHDHHQAIELDEFELLDDAALLDSEANSEDESEQVSLAMFDGDTSTMYPERRLCLNALLKHRYISGERHPEHWAVLMTSEAEIRSRLNDLFLDLEVDRDHRIAFKRAATGSYGEPLPSLLRSQPHSKEETIVMMSLRQRLFAQRQEGDDVVYVDRQTLLDEVADMRPDHATNRSMDHKRANNAIEGLATAGVLLRTQDPDRFRISPVIEILLPVPKLRSLWSWLMTANGTDATETEPLEAQDGSDGDEPDLLFDSEGDQP